MKTLFHGCTPTPLAGYLKGLGVLRLLSEQRPEIQVRGAWERGCFAVHGNITQEEVIAFFLNDYVPTPIIAPWNGASGFYFREEKTRDKDEQTGKLKKTGIRNQQTEATRVVAVIGESRGDRFARLRRSICIAQQVLREMKLHEAPKGDPKAALLARLRSTLPDYALDWFDAVLVLTSEKVAYPPLFATGGTDGNFDFTNNFMQRLKDVFGLADGEPPNIGVAWLDQALFGTTVRGLAESAIGQFNPGASGGANSSTGYDAKPAMNPWEFILMMEGAVLFAAAAVKRLESSTDGQMAYPFCVRPSGVGYGSATLSDEENSRCEMWMPLWEQPAGLDELKALLNEGRAQVNGRPARHGVDFARAVSSLGVDRGITAFQRYGFQVRNGLSYFATPLERVPVRRNQLATQLLAPLDDWLERFRRATHGSGPSAAVSAAERLDSAILAFCKDSGPSRTQEVLIALGRCERVMAGSQKWAHEAFLKPVPLLQPRWLTAAKSCTSEFRLAAALAGLTGFVGKTWLPFRSQLEPVVAGQKGGRRWYSWLENASRDVVWQDGPLVNSLNAVMARRVMLAARGECLADHSPISARLADIALFIEARTDDRLLASMIWGLSLVDFGAESVGDFDLGIASEGREPPAFYALLKLCFSQTVREMEVPLVPAIHRRAIAGDGAVASELAIRRLRASGLPVAVPRMHLHGMPVQRAASALLFPLAATDTQHLANLVLRPADTEPKPTTELV